MPLIRLTDSKLIDPKGIMPDQTATPFSGCMADDKKLIVEYTCNQGLSGYTLYFNPGLFVDSTRRYSPTSSAPRTSYQIKIDNNTPLNTLFEEGITSLSGNFRSQDWKNFKLEWQLTASNVFELHLTHYNTFDINTYIAAGAIINNDRRLLERHKDVYSPGTGVYDQQRNYGLYMYEEFFPSLFTVTVTATTVTIDDQTGEFDFSTLAAGTDYEIFIDDSENALLSSLTEDTSTTEQAKFTGTGLTPGVYKITSLQIKSSLNDLNEYWSFADQTTITSQTKATHNYLTVELSWYGEGVMSVPSFTFERSNSPVEKFSHLDNTDGVFEASHTGVVDTAKAWLIKVSDYNENLNFVDAYDLTELSLSLTNPSGNVYRSEFTVSSSEIDKNQQYRVIIIYYDSSGDIANSWITDTIVSLNEGEAEGEGDSNYKIPTIVSGFENYTLKFDGENYLNGVPVYDRIVARIRINKTTYPGTLNISSVKAEIEGITGLLTYSNGIWTANDGSLIDIENDDANNLELTLYFRVKKAWKGTAKYITWTIIKDGEPTTLIYKQRLDISLFESEKITPEIEYIRLQDPDTHAEITSFNGYEKEEVEIESKLKTGSDYIFHIAIINKGNGKIEESEQLNSPYMPQLQSSLVQWSMKLYTNEIGRYTIKVSDLRADYCVAVIARSLANVLCDGALPADNLWLVDTDGNKLRFLKDGNLYCWYYPE